MALHREEEIFGYPQGIALPPVHPGRTLSAELEARGLAASAARSEAARAAQPAHRDRSLPARSSLRRRCVLAATSGLAA